MHYSQAQVSSEMGRFFGADRVLFYLFDLLYSHPMRSKTLGFIQPIWTVFWSMFDNRWDDRQQQQQQQWHREVHSLDSLNENIVRMMHKNFLLKINRVGSDPFFGFTYRESWMHILWKSNSLHSGMHHLCRKEQFSEFAFCYWVIDILPKTCWQLLPLNYELSSHVKEVLTTRGKI